MLDIRATDTGGEFGAHRELASLAFVIALSDDSEELFSDDVRVLANAAFKHAAVLEDRRINALVTGLAATMTYHLLDIGVVLVVLGEDVVSAFRGAEERFGHG